MDQTGSLTPIEALNKAIMFTLLHDPDIIIDALYELAIKHS